MNIRKFIAGCLFVLLSACSSAANWQPFFDDPSSQILSDNHFTSLIGPTAIIWTEISSNNAITIFPTIEGEEFALSLYDTFYNDDPRFQKTTLGDIKSAITFYKESDGNYHLRYYNYVTSHEEVIATLPDFKKDFIITIQPPSGTTAICLIGVSTNHIGSIIVHNFYETLMPPHGLVVNNGTINTKKLEYIIRVVDKNLYRINIGGTNFIDADGLAYSADTSTLGRTHTNPNIPQPYGSERYGADLKWEFILPEGYHVLELHFKEIYFTEEGRRIFDVLINGNVELADLDLVKKRNETVPKDPFIFKRLIKSDGVTKTVITFAAKKDLPKLSALVINQLKRVN